MALVDRDLLLAVVAEARRAPSARNQQPARWRLRDDVIELLEDPARRLPACDPSGRDHRLALGAAWEGTRLALSSRGLRFDDEVLAAVPDEQGVVACGRVVDGGMKDLLVDVVMRRATWRGNFLAVQAHVLGDVAADLEPLGAVLVQNPAIIEDAARVIDEASAASLLRPSAIEELVGWLRLSRDHPGWERDGLNADMLDLSPFSARLQSLALRRGPLSQLHRARLAHLVVGEADQTRSASALIAVLAQTDEIDIVVGARFYRCWLTVTSAGLHVCPMSVLTADEALGAQFSRALGLPAGWKLLHLWRVGRAPRVVPLSPRLPPEELIT